MIPTWLRDRLGGPTRRGVTVRRCRACRASILEGWDGDQLAVRATVDPDPVTALGEALALLAGRSSYELRSYTAGMALHQRDRWQITGRNADQHFVLVDHECDAVPLPHRIVSIPVQPKGKVRSDDKPPF